MLPDETDAGYLWDMLQAARAVQRFVAAVGRIAYLNDEMIQAAVERKIAGQRHVLAHDYGRIEHDRLWDVATVHISALIAQLEGLLPQ